MLQKPPKTDNKKADPDSPAIAALKCAYEIMRQRIISNPKDMVGVLLFGMEESKYSEATDNEVYPHCYVLTDLDVPDAAAVRTLSNLATLEGEADELLVPAKNKEEVTMANLLFCANQIFTTKAPNFGSRRLFMITDNDDPHADDKKMREAAAVRAKDLYDLGVVIELFPISHPGSGDDFDRSKFYDDVIYSGPENPDGLATSAKVKLEAGATESGITLLQSLISDVNSKQVAKRALFSNLPFEIAPNLTISVKGYNILQRQKPTRSCYVWLDGERAMIAKGETRQTGDEGGKEVKKVEIKKAYKFGGEQVVFTKDEQKELKNFGPPGLRIIGFKDRKLLPKWASVNKSTFIYPSEEDYVGSTRVFSALWEKLLKSEKIGIAWYIARSNANPSLVAIIPSAETLDPLTMRQLRPAGLWLYPLPYADDLRQPAPSPKPVIAGDKLVDALGVVVQQLKLPKGPFDPSRYPNPALQWHYRILQAMALDEELPEWTEKDDKTLPKAKQIHKRAGEYLVEWGMILEEDNQNLVKGAGLGAGAGAKRGAAAEKPPPKKRAPAKKIKSEVSKSLQSSKSFADLYLNSANQFVSSKVNLINDFGSR